MRTTVWTASNYAIGYEQGKPRKIFDGDVPVLLHKGMSIQVLDGFALHTIADVSYSIPNNTQEVHLVRMGDDSEYPTVD